MHEIQKLDETSDEAAKRHQTLTTLAAKGYLELALYSRQRAELNQEAKVLKEERENLARAVDSGISTTDEAEMLLKSVSEAAPNGSFQQDAFLRFVDEIIVYSQKEIGFRLKCGITLKEALAAGTKMPEVFRLTSSLPQSIQEDPCLQAEYAYSLIESEVAMDGNS